MYTLLAFCSLLICWRCPTLVLLPLRSVRYGQEFRQLLARAPDDKTKYKDHETLLSFYTEDVMRAAEREVIATFDLSRKFFSVVREDM